MNNWTTPQFFLMFQTWHESYVTLVLSGRLISDLLLVRSLLAIIYSSYGQERFYCRLHILHYSFIRGFTQVVPIREIYWKQGVEISNQLTIMPKVPERIRNPCHVVDGDANQWPSNATHACELIHRCIRVHHPWRRHVCSRFHVCGSLTWRRSADPTLMPDFGMPWVKHLFFVADLLNQWVLKWVR